MPMKNVVLESLEDSIAKSLKILPEQDQIKVLLSVLRRVPSVASADIITAHDLEHMARIAQDQLDQHKAKHRLP